MRFYVCIKWIYHVLNYNCHEYIHSDLFEIL